MSRPTVVVKFGGEALASPSRIVAAARRVQRLAAEGPVCVVASARRGVTDHLLGLVQEVVAESGAAARAADGNADRAVAAGEVVAASLLAHALTLLGRQAIALDAREAGIWSGGRGAAAVITAVRPRRIEALLERGVVPVVTGFQGWHRGRVTTLGRGGSDTSAVALATAVAALRCDFVKDTPGLLTADPKLVPAARLIPHAPHRFVTALAEAGARVLHPAAARLAEEHGLPLQFLAIDGEGVLSLVETTNEGAGELRAVAARDTGDGTSAVSLVGHEISTDGEWWDRLTSALAHAGHAPEGLVRTPVGARVVVPTAGVAETVRLLHHAFVESTGGSTLLRRAS